MPRGRPVPKLNLTVEERETLQRWARQPKTAQALACERLHGENSRRSSRGPQPLIFLNWRLKFE
jgi:hypothetical protein